MGRTMPTECDHGYIMDWGGFGCMDDCTEESCKEIEPCPEGCNDFDEINEPLRRAARMNRSFVPPGPREELLWIGVDLDDTIAKGVWPEPGIGEPIWENVAKVRELIEHGFKVVVYTARGWEDFELVESWLEHHDIPYNRLECGKMLLRAMVDDKNVLPESESWLPGS